MSRACSTTYVADSSVSEAARQGEAFDVRFATPHLRPALERDVQGVGFP
jgi:hypothetical protein